MWTFDQQLGDVFPFDVSCSSVFLAIHVVVCEIVINSVTIYDIRCALLINKLAVYDVWCEVFIECLIMCTHST